MSALTVQLTLFQMKAEKEIFSTKSKLAITLNSSPLYSSQNSLWQTWSGDKRKCCVWLWKKNSQVKWKSQQRPSSLEQILCFGKIMTLSCLVLPFFLHFISSLGKKEKMPSWVKIHDQVQCDKWLQAKYSSSLVQPGKPENQQSHSVFSLLCYFQLLVCRAGMEPRALGMLGKPSTIELYPEPVTPVYE